MTKTKQVTLENPLKQVTLGVPLLKRLVTIREPQMGDFEGFPATLTTDEHHILLARCSTMTLAEVKALNMRDGSRCIQALADLMTGK